MIIYMEYNIIIYSYRYAIQVHTYVRTHSYVLAAP